MSNRTTSTKAQARPAKPPVAPPCLMVIFGAAGDLAKRLLIPSLYNLTRDGLLGRGFKVLGVDHNTFDDKSFQAEQSAFIHGLAKDKTSEFGKTKLSKAAWSRLCGDLGFMQGDLRMTPPIPRWANALARQPMSSSTSPPRRAFSATSSSAWPRPG